MSALIKYLKKDNTGDYTNITTAFNDMLISGLAATGSITNYYLNIDNGSYNGTLSGYIPYSGVFNIIGNQTYLKLSNCINKLSGIYQNTNSNNLVLDNIIIDCSGLTSNWFNIPSGFSLSIRNSQIINDIYGIKNSGIFHSTNVESCGILGQSKYFVYQENGLYSNLNNTSISNYNTGLYSSNLSVSNSNIHNNGIGIFYGNGHSTNIDHTLMYDNLKDINVSSGFLYITQSTFNDPIYINNSKIFADRIISNTTGINISGIGYSGSVIQNSCLYPGSILGSNVSGFNIINLDPLFNNPSNKDFKLKLSKANGSPCIELYEDPNYSLVDIDIDNSKLRLIDKKGPIKNSGFLYYTFTQGNTLLFSDYNQEIKFAELIKYYNNLTYDVSVNLIFDEFNTVLTESFSMNDNLKDPHPFDWDIKQLSSTQIVDYNTYIIPRSIIDVVKIISNKVFDVNKIDYSLISKDNIKLYVNPNVRGISYDSSLSTPSSKVMWVIDVNNQSLKKVNVYSSEEIEYYPLLCSSPSKTHIRPSGLIYTGVNGDYYTFIKQDDPNIQVLGLNELGDFYWICTDINTKFDLRGIKSYKDNLFITAGEYYLDVTNRTIIQSGECHGRLLQYNSNDLFLNYIKSANETNGPRMYSLNSQNNYPTDVSIYEDGSLFIADYLSASGIFKYDLAYDYALINSSYDNESRVLLREKYTNVDL